jgi:hypothetical protein
VLCAFQQPADLDEVVAEHAVAAADAGALDAAAAAWGRSRITPIKLAAQRPFQRRVLYK